MGKILEEIVENKIKKDNTLYFNKEELQEYCLYFDIGMEILLDLLNIKKSSK